MMSQSMYAAVLYSCWALGRIGEFRPSCQSAGDINRSITIPRHILDHFNERTGPPGNLALAGWAGWSAGQVGRHVKC